MLLSKFNDFHKIYYNLELKGYHVKYTKFIVKVLNAPPPHPKKKILILIVK